MGKVLKFPASVKRNRTPEMEACIYAQQICERRSMNSLELSYYMADMFTGFLENISPKTPPMRPPILRELAADKKTDAWKNKRDSDRAVILSKVYSRSHVKNYLDDCGKCRANNISDMVMLEKCILLWIDIGDDQKGKICWDKYQEYEDQKIGGRIVHKKKTVQEIIEEDNDNKEEGSV